MLLDAFTFLIVNIKPVSTPTFVDGSTVFTFLIVNIKLDIYKCL